jgi:tRNA (cytidine/uridine-2'-O-)-methyltransferase
LTRDLFALFQIAHKGVGGRLCGQFGARRNGLGASTRLSLVSPLLLGRAACNGEAMRIALYEPDIPQNTGTILRLGACLGVPVDVIAPTGFDMTDRTLRRAGLDYLPHVEIVRHASFADFEAGRRRGPSRLVLLTTRSTMAYTSFAFRPEDTLLLGRESAGVPDAIHELADARLRIPLRPRLRSLNVAVACAMVLGEALRQTDGFSDA